MTVRCFGEELEKVREPVTNFFKLSRKSTISNTKEKANARCSLLHVMEVKWWGKVGRREGGGSEPFAFFKRRNPAMKKTGPPSPPPPFHTTDFYEMGQWPLHGIHAACHLSLKSYEHLDPRLGQT